MAVVITPTKRSNSLSLDLMGSQMSVVGLSNLFQDSSSSCCSSRLMTPQRPVDVSLDYSPCPTITHHERDSKRAIMDPIDNSFRNRSSSSGSALRIDTCPAEEEKRQDDDCVVTSAPGDITSSSSIGVRASHRTPMAVLKLRRRNLFPSEEGKPTKPFSVTYNSSSPSSFDDRDECMASHSISSSMFLVSPLRPLTASSSRRRSDNTTPEMDFRTSLIDSSRSILRPLTPPNPKQHRPKRSLSDANLLANHRDEESKECDDDDDGDVFMHHYQAPFRQQQQSRQVTPTPQHQQQQQLKKRWLIPAEHPYKVLWDLLTFILSFANVYATHTAIRDRQFGNSWFMSFCEAWFMVDILLNFITEYRSGDYALTDCRSVWARYLTTWFVVDVLSLLPGEALYLRPIIDQQNRRGFFKKNFFRTKAVVRVTRILRGRHLKLFGQVTKHSKHAGVGAARLLQLLIKYIPKYLLFYRNMKGLLALRTLRQVHWFRKVWRNFIYWGLLADETSGVPPEDAKATLRRKYRPEYDDGAPF